MQLVMPGIGLLFWMVLSFGILLYLLSKYAWKPIMSGIHQREDTIEKALLAAEEAKKEMAKLQAGNEQMMREAREERDALMRDARKMKDAILEESRKKGAEESERIIAQARENIQHEKMAAINDLKNQISAISLDIAEKVLGNELEDKQKQEQLTNRLLKDVKIN